MTHSRILACAFSCCPPGKPGFTGGEDQLGWNLLKQVARFHEVWALTHAAGRYAVEEALQEEPVPNLHFYYVSLPAILRPLLRFQGTHQFYYYLWQIIAYFAAKKLQKKHHFDLFHHITYANDWMVSFIGAFLPIPYIRGPGGGAHRTPKGLEGEYSLSGRVWEKVRFVGQWLFRHDPLFVKGQRRAHTILLCNRESIANIPYSWADKVLEFPVNGISSRDLALSSKSKFNAGKFRVLSAGSLIRVKGFRLAIRAFGEFAAKHPDARFSIVGSGPEAPGLRSLVDRAQLQDKVDFIQSEPRDELLTRMASCDVFLFPSLRDGGGAVVIEAMSAGKPVICLDTGGPGMHVTEECGVKVLPASGHQTIHDLASALERLYMDLDLRKKMGRAARERAEQTYHWDRLGERLMETYRQTLARNGK